jgi:DNA primase
LSLPEKTQNFMDRELFPAVFASLDVVFPELGLKRKGDGWVATQRNPLFGDVRPDRVVCRKGETAFYIHDGSRLPNGPSWTALVLNQTTLPRGADFFNALRELGKRAGVDCSPLDLNLSPEQRRERDAAQRRGELWEDFQQILSQTFLSPVGNHAREYLKARGFEEASFSQTEFGFFESVEAVRKSLKALKYSAEEVESSGVLHDSRWTGRLTHPVRGLRGRVETFWARDLTGTADKGSKYLKLTGGKVFAPLFGLDSVDYAAPLVICEGYLDALHARAKGFKNVAATGGTLKNLKWEGLLELEFPSFVLCTDNDEEKEDGRRVGEEALLQSLNNLSKVDKGSKVYVLPPEELGEHKDPDEYARANGFAAFLNLLEEKSVSWVEYVAAGFMENVDETSPRMVKDETIRRVLGFTEGVVDSPLREEWVSRVFQDLSKKTGTSLAALSLSDSNAKERLKRENAEKDAKRSAEEFANALNRGGDFSKEEARLSSALSALKLSGESAPAEFTVEGVLEELKHLPSGLKTPWESLNETGVRLRPQELILVAARTGHGKTSVLANLFLHLVRQDSQEVRGRVLFYSHEEPRTSVFARLASSLTTGTNAKWSVSEIRNYLRGEQGTYSNPQTLEDAKELLRQWEDRIQIVNRPEWTASQIAADVKRRRDREDVAAVFVDYLQRLPFDRDGGEARKDEKISVAARTLKSLAMDLSVPVIAGAQINRESVPKNYTQDLQEAVSALKDETQENPKDVVKILKTSRPDLHHLREGGSEQEADVILGLLNHASDVSAARPVLTAGEKKGRFNLFEIGVLKERFGERGAWVELKWVGLTQTVVDRE